MASALPEGFVLDDEPVSASSSGLPEGFELDADEPKRGGWETFSRNLEGSAAKGTVDTIGGVSRIAANQVASTNLPKEQNQRISDNQSALDKMDEVVKQQGFEPPDFAQRRLSIQQDTEDAKRTLGLSQVAGTPEQLSASPEGEKLRKDIATPLLGTASLMSEAAKGVPQLYGTDPNDKSLPAQIGRGAGTVLAMAPTIALTGPVGLGAGVVQGASQSYQDTYDSTAEKLKAQGLTDPAEIDKQSQEAASEEAVKTFPALMAYFIGGKLASDAVAKLLPNATPIVKGIAGATGATAANVAVSSTIKGIEGQSIIPNAEELTQHLGFGVIHGGNTFHEAVREAKIKTLDDAANNSDENNAPLVSRTLSEQAEAIRNLPDGAFAPKPEGEKPLTPIEEIPKENEPNTDERFAPPRKPASDAPPGLPENSQEWIKKQVSERGITEAQAFDEISKTRNAQTQWYDSKPIGTVVQSGQGHYVKLRDGRWKVLSNNGSENASPDSASKAQSIAKDTPTYFQGDEPAVIGEYVNDSNLEFGEKLNPDDFTSQSDTPSKSPEVSLNNKTEEPLNEQQSPELEQPRASDEAEAPVSKEEETTQTAPDYTQGLRGEGEPADTIRQTYNKQLAPYSPLLAGEGITVQPHAEEGKQSNVSYDADGNIALNLEHPESIVGRSQTPEELAHNSGEHLHAVLNEEMFHVADLVGLRNQWKSEGSKGSFTDFVDNKVGQRGKDLREVSNDREVQAITNSYNKTTGGELTDQQLGFEFTRQVGQRLRSGKITEDVTILGAKARAGDKAAKGFLDHLVDSLKVLRDTLSKYIDGGKAPKSIKDALQTANEILDKYSQPAETKAPETQAGETHKVYRAETSDPTDHGWYGQGKYFSPDESLARGYADSKNPKVIEAEVTLQKPLEVRVSNTPTSPDVALGATIRTIEQDVSPQAAARIEEAMAKSDNPHKTGAEEIRKVLQENGYDGVKVFYNAESSYHPEKGSIYTGGQLKELVSFNENKPTDSGTIPKTVQPSVEQAENRTSEGEGGEPPARNGSENPEQPQPSVTGIRNSIIDKERVERGLPPRMKDLERAFPLVWDEAMAKIDAEPGIGSRLINEIKRSNRGIESDVETAILTREAVDRNTEFYKALEAVNNARDGVERDAAQKRMEAARNADMEIKDVLQRSKGHTARTLNSFKLMSDDAYSLTGMEAQARAVANEGLPLSKDQEAAVKKDHDEISKRTKDFDDAEDKVSREQAQGFLDQLLKETKKEVAASKRKGQSVLDLLEEQAVKARVRAREKMGRASAGVDPTLLVDYAIVGANWLAKGAVKLADFTSRMVKEFGDGIHPNIQQIFESSKQYYDSIVKLHDQDKPTKSAISDVTKGQDLKPKTIYDLVRENVNKGVEGLDKLMLAVKEDLKATHPDITVREIRDLFTGYGKVKFPSKEEDLVKVREYKRLGQLTSAIEDARKKQPPKKTGLQRDKPTQQVREMEKELIRVMREEGIEPAKSERSLKSSLDTIRTRLRNEIEDLEKQLATGAKTPKKPGVEYDDEANALKARRDFLREQVRAIEGKPEISNEQKLRTAMAAAEKSLAEYDRRIQEGDFSDPSKPKGVTSPELEKIKAERDATKEYYNQLKKEASGELSPEEKRNANLVFAAKKRIARLDERIQNEELTNPKKESKAPITPELEALKAEGDAMRDYLKELQDAAKPKLTDEERAQNSLEGRLKSQIAGLLKEFETGTRRERNDPTIPGEKALQLLEVRDNLKSVLEKVRDDKTITNEEKIKRASDAMDKSIAEYERRLKEKDFSPKNTSEPIPETPELKALREKRDALRKDYQDAKKGLWASRTPEEIDLARYKKYIANRTKQVLNKIATNDYEPKTQKERILDKEAMDALFELSKAKKAFNEGLLQYKLAKRNRVQKIIGTTGETLNTARALQTGFDLSAVLRQGGFITIGNPVMASKSIVPMLRALASKKEQFKIEQEIAKRPNANLYEKAGLFLAKDGETLTKMEEQYMSRWLDKIGESAEKIFGKIPVIGKPIGKVAEVAISGPQRAYTTFLNKLRADTFDAMTRSFSVGGTPTLAEAKALAAFVNIATGRAQFSPDGQLGPKANALLNGTNTLLFAPRYLGSRIQLLAGAPLYGGTARTRKVIAGYYGRYLLGMSIMYALAQSAGFGLEFDTRSADFGKIKIGNTRLDPVSGLAQITRLIAEIGTGEKKNSKGKIVPLRENNHPLNLIRKPPYNPEAKVKYGGQRGGEVLGRFVWSKLAPVPGAGVNIIQGENVAGDSVTVPSALAGLFKPLSVSDMMETFQEQGGTKGAAITALSILGMGVQTYDSNKKHEK